MLQSGTKVFKINSLMAVFLPFLSGCFQDMNLWNSSPFVTSIAPPELGS
jgi:hypothetical protein